MKINKPNTHSEFECQAYLYFSLLNKGVDIKGEVLNKSESKNSKGKREVCRFDLVIFEGDSAKHIIEVKGDRRKDCSRWEKTRQGVKYSKFGIEVTLLVGMEQCKHFVENYQV